MNRNTAVIGFAFLVLMLLVTTPSYVAAQDTLSFSLSRDFGTGLGSSIEGTFTLHGSGPLEIIGLIVFFNGVEVHSVTGNTISWQFQTGDYPSGETNITLYGWDDEGVTYVATQHLTFLSDNISNVITLGIIVLVIVLIIFRYVPKILSRGK